MTVAAVTASDLPVVLAALGAQWGAPPTPRRLPPCASGAPEEGRPAPEGTGRTQSFEETKPHEEEVSCA